MEEPNTLVQQEIVCFFISNDNVRELFAKVGGVLREFLPEAHIYEQDFTLIIDEKATMVIRQGFTNVVEITYRFPIEEAEKYLDVIYHVGGKFDTPTYANLRCLVLFFEISITSTVHRLNPCGEDLVVADLLIIRID
nr:hypothetical protein HmN_000579300 [Hymenolepis microstoma]